MVEDTDPIPGELVCWLRSDPLLLLSHHLSVGMGERRLSWVPLHTDSESESEDRSEDEGSKGQMIKHVQCDNNLLPCVCGCVCVLCKVKLVSNPFCVVLQDTTTVYMYTVVASCNTRYAF